MKDKLTASMPRHFPEEMAEAKKLVFTYGRGGPMEALKQESL
jgi:hypothetical protein